MPRVPAHLVQQSLGAPGTAEGLGSSMLATVSAAAGLAGDITEANAEVLGVFEQQQELQNRTTILDARREMTDTLNNIQSGLDPTAPSSWVPAFDEAAADWKTNFEGRELPPVVRRTIEEDAQNSFSRARHRTGNAALQKNTSLARQTYGDATNHSLSRGNFSEARSLLAEQREAKLIEEPDFKRKSREIDAIEGRQALLTLIEKDPGSAAVALDDADFLKKHPSLTLADQTQLAKHADQAINKGASELWTSVLHASLDDDPAILSTDDLAAYADLGIITPAQRAQYLRAYHGEQAPTEDPELYSQTAHILRSYNPEQDLDGYQLATLRSRLATVALPKAHLRQLSEILDEVAKPEEEQKPSTKISKNFDSLTEQYFQQGKFGGWFKYQDHDNNSSTMDKKVITLESYGKALAARSIFENKWESYLKEAPADLNEEQANEDFGRIFNESLLSTPASNPFNQALPAAPKAQNFDKALEKILGEEGDKGPSSKEGKPQASLGKPVFRMEFSTYQKRRDIFKAGGTPILLDTNSFDKNNGITQPLVVIPDNASTEQRKAAQSYADGIAKALNMQLGREMKGHVRTTSENGRGRSYAFHTEPFALTDAAARRFMTSADGMALHGTILKRTLGKLPDANFFIPHAPGDPGAVVNGLSEVSHARQLLRTLDTSLPQASLQKSRQEARKDYFRTHQPTDPASIQAGLEEIDILQGLRLS